MGYESRAGFEAALLEELRAVESHLRRPVREDPRSVGSGKPGLHRRGGRPGDAGNPGAAGASGNPAGSPSVSASGITAATARPAARGARELLTELIPTVLETLSTTNDPDAALLRFDDFLRTLPAGVHILSLFTNNPALLGLLAKIMGSAPRLADWLSRHPIMLEGVLQPAALDFNAGSDRLTADLEEALDEVYYFEEKLDICRYWNNAHVFEIGVQMLKRPDRRGGCGPAARRSRDGLRACPSARDRARIRAQPRGRAGQRIRRARLRQARRAGAHHRVGPRPPLPLRDAGRACRIGRFAPAALPDLLRPAVPAFHRRHVGADQRREALRGRHAAAPGRRVGADRHLARRVHTLSERRRLDLGASGAHPRQGDRRARSVRRAHREHHRLRAHPGARPRPAGLRGGRHAGENGTGARGRRLLVDQAVPAAA